jgi:hypothetical protein
MPQVEVVSDEGIIKSVEWRKKKRRTAQKLKRRHYDKRALSCQPSDPPAGGERVETSHFAGYEVKRQLVNTIRYQVDYSTPA